MSERKETPDLLGDLLSAGVAPEPLPAAPASAPKPARSRTARRPAQPKAQPAAPQPPPAAPEPPPAAPLPPAPPQWEYREVTFREYRGWRPRYVDGRERWDWKEAPTMLDYLRQVGDEGWELVSIGAEHNFQKTAYFKRLKAG